MRCALLLLVLTACGSDSSTQASEATTPPLEPPSETVPSCTGDVREVSFSTADGETLAADHHVAAEPGRGAIVLFHMIPPGNDRTGYPKRVREVLSDLGVTVLNVDRRGAGASSGDPESAYTGAGARLDMEAAVRYLLDEDAGCTVSPDKLLLVGASNGTTSVHDYTAEHDTALPDPAAVVWMSPGTYTETQVPVTGSETEATPVLWLYPTNEAYSGDFIGGSSSWEFVERGSVHGTQMFDGGQLEADTVADLVSWVERWIL